MITDKGCSSRIFYPSRIPDPGSRGQKGTGSLNATVPLSCPWALVLFLWFLSLCVCEQLQRMRTGNCDHSVGNRSNSRVQYTMIKCKVYCVHYNNNISWKRHTSAFTLSPYALQRRFELCIPRNQTARPCSQIPHSYICGRFIQIHRIYFAAAK